jgi:hypothetical protein
MYSKFSILFLFQFLVLSSIYSQKAGEFSLSGRAGIGQSIIQSKNTGFSTSNSRLSLSAGLLSDYWFTEDLSFETGFILLSKGGDVTTLQQSRGDIKSTNTRYELLYGEIPLTPKYTWQYNNFTLHTYVGPAMNLLFSQRTSDETLSDPYYGHEGPREQNVSKANVGLIYGFGINSFFRKKGNFFADLRLSTDMSPFATVAGDKLYNHYYSIAAGYTFR